MLVIVLNMGFQKCWYKQSEDSNRYLFYRHFKPTYRQEKHESHLHDVYVFAV